MLNAVSDFYDETEKDFEALILTEKGNKIKVKIFEKDFTE